MCIQNVYSACGLNRLFIYPVRNMHYLAVYRDAVGRSDRACASYMYIEGSRGRFD